MNKKISIMLTQGLGNQMFEYSALLYYADKYNKIPVLNTNFTYVGSNKYQGNFVLNVFKLNKNIRISSFAINDFTYYIYRIFYRFFIEAKKTTFIDMDGKKQNKINKNTKYLQSYFVNSKFPNKIRKKLLKDFVPKNNLSNKANEYINDIQKQKVSISLHCRRGDYVNLVGYEQYGKNYYKKALKKLKDKGIIGKIYIFSDDIEWCEKNLSDLGDVVFVKGTKNALEDMWIMSKCQHNIIPNSTFSWWGAWLNQNEQKTIIMPEKWHKPSGLKSESLNMQGAIVLGGEYE